MDVRKTIDAAVRRSWGDLGWRVMRAVSLMVSDLLAAALSALLALLMLRSAGVGHLALSTGFVQSLVMMHVVGMGLAGAYGLGYRRKEVDRIVYGTGWGILAATVNALFLSAITVRPEAALWLVPYALGAVALSFTGRIGLDRLSHAVYRRGWWQRRVLVVGSAGAAARLERRIQGSNDQHLRIVGRVSTSREKDEGAVGTMADLKHALEQTKAKGVLVDAGLTFEALETLVHECFRHGLTVAVVPRILHKLSPRMELRETRAGALVQLQPQGPRLPQLALKRLADVVASALLMLLLSPVLLFIAVSIRLDSPGGVLFKQTRAGVGGRPFDMYKFRTMVTDADAQKGGLQHLNQSGDPRLFKIVNDPRVTRLGAFLRRFSLDELPQLINVLKGEMSLVGPRPFFPGDLDHYEAHHFQRLGVLPGITGLWQVSGRSDVVDFEEVVRLDTEYIRNWSLGMDLSILARTIPAAFGRNGAY